MTGSERESGQAILANSGYRSLAEVGSKAATVVLYIVLAREVGSSEFGVYTLAISLVTIATALGGFGQDVVLTREVSRDRKQVHRLFANTLFMRLGLSLPVLLLVLAAGTTLGLSSHQELVALLLGLGVTADLLTSVCFAVYQAHDRFEFLAVVLIAQRWFTAVVGVVALARGAGVETVALVYLVGAIGAFVLAMTLLRRQVTRPAMRLDLGTWPNLFREAAPIGLASVFYVITVRADAALLAAFEPDRVVGQYGAATRLLEGTLFISFSVAAGAFPAFSRVAPTATADENVLLGRSVKLAFAPSLLVAVVLGVLARPLVGLLFGDDYLDAASALMILAPAIAIYPIGFICSYWLVARGRQRRLVGIFAGVAAANLALNVILIPLLSLDGAALVLSLSQAGIAVGAFVSARGEGGVVKLSRAFAGPLVAGAASAAAMAPFHNDVAIALPVGTVAFAGVLLMMERRFCPEDVASLIARLRPKPDLS